MVTDYKEFNTRLAENIAVTDGAEREKLLNEFLTENNTLITKIAFNLLKPGGEFEDVLTNTQLAVIDCLENSAAIDYIQNYTFWTVVTNRCKSLLHYEKGTGINYQTFKRNVRKGDIPQGPINVDDDNMYEWSQSTNPLLLTENTVERQIFDQVIKDDFENAFSTLTEREQKAISCKAWAEFDEPVSRRTYCRDRASAKQKMLKNLSYDREDYEAAFSN